MRNLAIAASAVCLLAASAFAGPLHGRPNLKAAHVMIKHAMEKVSAAQSANEFDMGGHAQKAKDLLVDAEREINLAAEAADEHK